MVRSAFLSALFVSLAAPAFAQSGPFLEQGGRVVVEIEATAPVGNWAVETEWTGFTGASYYRWNGSNQFNTPGIATLKYDLAIGNAGDYWLAIHNRHNHPDPSQENDVWVRVDGGTWFKVFSNQGPSTVAKWTWATEIEVGSQHLNPVWTLDRGIHRIEISARSKHFMIDRFHLYLPGTVNAKNINAAQSPIYTGQSDIQNYCTAKVASNGCVPTMAATGQPNLGGPFVVSATQLINNKSGILFHGSAPAATPFYGGLLCVAPPLRRLPAQSSGPGTNCTGTISVDFGALTHPSLALGATTYVQCWFRDGADPHGAGMSDGIRFTWIL